MSGEKITATLSTLTALAILGAGVVAQPSRTPKAVPTADRIAKLESALRYQLDLNSRHDRGAFRDRTAELEQTLAAWNASPKAPADAELLEAWLRESISRSLPNKRQPLPPTPAFGAPVVEQPPATAVKNAETKRESVPPRAKPEQGVVPRTSPKPKAAPHPATPVIVKKEIVEPTPPAPIAPPAEPADLPIAVETVAAPPKLGEPTPQVAPAAAPAPPEPVSINLSELNARIRGYHDGHDEIVADIVAAGDEPTLAQATRLTRQVVNLAEQRRFLQLYYDSLTDRERRIVTEPRSMKETVDLVEKFVSSVELPAAVDDFLASAEEIDPRDELLESLKEALNQP